MSTARLAGAGGALFGALAVLLGAFGAHALGDRLAPDALRIWGTAVDYLFWHALALLVVAERAARVTSRSLSVATVGFASGIVLFCGSLFALASEAPRTAGMLTPIGGLAFIVGWAALGSDLARKRAT